MQSSSQIVTTNKPTSSFFYSLDALPVARPIVSKTEWKTEGNYSIKIQATSKFMLNSSPENGNVDNF